MELTKNRLPIFRNEHLPHIRELYEEQQDAVIDVVPEKEVSYQVGDEVVVDLPTRTIEGTIGYVGETDVRTPVRTVILGITRSSTGSSLRRDCGRRSRMSLN